MRISRIFRAIAAAAFSYAASVFQREPEYLDDISDANPEGSTHEG